MEKGAKVAKGRAEESPDVKQGNFSLYFPKVYFSDSGTYRCSEHDDSTILQLKGTFAEFVMMFKGAISRRNSEFKILESVCLPPVLVLTLSEQT